MSQRRPVTLFAVLAVVAILAGVGVVIVGRVMPQSDRSPVPPSVTSSSAAPVVPSYLEPVTTASYAPLDGLSAGSKEAQESQREWAAKGYPLEVKLKGTDIRFRLIPPGSFMMGSPGGEDGRYDDEGPQHRVTISKPFYMAVTEITQAQWQKVMNGNPSYFSRDRCGIDTSELPVEQVSWNDCQGFIEKLRRSSGATGLRLPTEAEWEYSCRAGTSSAIYTGALRILGANNGPELDAIAWYSGNSGVTHKGGYNSSGWSEKQYNHKTAGTHPVGGKLANGFGLHDMIGNVWEWCGDWYGSYSSTSLTDPTGPGEGTSRVLRNGSWYNNSRDCRSAYRISFEPDLRSYSVGLRVSLDLVAQTSAPPDEVAVPTATAPSIPSFFEPVTTASYAPLDGLSAGSKEAQDGQREWVAKGYPLEVKLRGTDIRFRLIPPGSFMMGSPDGEHRRDNDEGPVHRVTINNPFYLAVTEVTQAQWQKVMGSNPSFFSPDRCGIDTSDLPVEQVNWDDCQGFIEKLRRSSGATGLRLPTEAEWEYSCRAGTSSAIYTGALRILGENNGPELDAISWYGGNSGVTHKGGYDSSGWSEKQYNHKTAGTHPVAGKLANAWGLHDMLGNVREWCEDNWHDNYYGAPENGTAWLGDDPRRILRGGCWYPDPGYCRTAYRFRCMPYYRLYYFGFRPVLDLP